MAARGKTIPVGSAQWAQNERNLADEFIAQDADEFSYSVRNELEWLNEHMAEIFSKTDVNYADMFKTPGKLRGKTPRTARKVNALAPRQPLTDIFAPNGPSAAPSPAKNTAFFEKVSQFQLPINDENRSPQRKPAGRGTSPQRVGKPYPYADSGYHGMMTEDEMEMDAQRSDSIASSSQVGEHHVSKVPVREDQPPAQRLHEGNGDEHVNSDDSFVSAKEGGAETGADELMGDAPTDTQPYTREEEAELVAEAVELNHVVQVYEDEPIADEVPEEAQQHPEPESAPAVQDQDVDMEADAADAQSDTSSPEKPLNRKSSFNFSSLPARDTVTSKRSMGQFDLHRNSVFNKSIGARQTEGLNTEDVQDKAVEAKANNKTTAQLLHDRINMLDKTKEPRPSKSIHQLASFSQSTYPQLPTAEGAAGQREQPSDVRLPSTAPEQPIDNVDDDEDDWIAPTKPANALQHKKSEGGLQPSPAKLASPRPAMHTKSISTTDIPSPSRTDMGDSRHQKAISVSHPNLAEMLESTTPVGSPSRKTNDGPLSASKSRLWSALKSAKSIFASSASASAAAKLEAHNSPALTRSPTRDTVEQPHKMFNMPGGIWSQKDVLQSPARNNSVISFSPSRKTRHSNESEKRREKEFRAQEKAAVELEKAREKERVKAAKHQAEEAARQEKAAKAEAARVEKERQQAAKAAANAPRPQSADSEKASESEMAPPPPPKASMLPAGKLRAPGRLMRPTKEPAQTRPAPVAVRMPSQAPRAGQAPSSFSKSQHENLASSTSSHAGPRAGSAQGHRPGTAGGNARVRALEAAARKKEADEKAAAKKAEQKRELERKRAEKAEHEKRVEEERKAAEQQRALEARQAAERKATEKRAAEVRKREQDRADQQRREQERLDQQRREQDRIEQQRREAERLRQEEDARRAREAHDLAEAIRRERSQPAQQHPRGDLPGTIRQLGKNTIPSANPAKPAKRQFPIEDDEPQQSHRPGILRNAPSYQQMDGKRRRTNEEQDEANQRNSVMAPPKRPSTMRKETLSKFSGYTHAPPPAAHHSSMFKSTVTAQHQMQHSNKPVHPSQLVQTSNARIPFAESAKTPGQASHSQYQSNYESNKFKTPSRPMAPKSAKSTPQYPQGDNIELPDIATDSEDEEDDDDEPGGFRAPSWTASPALRDLLTQQQLMDPEAVFGPIGELKMEEVFKNGKNQDRLKRFRDRGSSAMWVETGDAVTSAEKRRDMELRERVVREGGWRFEPGV